MDYRQVYTFVNVYTKLSIIRVFQSYIYSWQMCDFELPFEKEFRYVYTVKKHIKMYFPSSIKFYISNYIIKANEPYSPCIFANNLLIQL